MAGKVGLSSGAATNGVTAVQISNSNFNGAYIFSGTKTDQPAFVTTGSPTITAVTYQGDEGQRLRRISRQDTSAVNTTGTR